MTCPHHDGIKNIRREIVQITARILVSWTWDQSFFKWCSNHFLIEEKANSFLIRTLDFKNLPDITIPQWGKKYDFYWTYILLCALNSSIEDDTYRSDRAYHISLVDMASIIIRNWSAFPQKDEKCNLNKWKLFPK